MIKGAHVASPTRTKPIPVSSSDPKAADDYEVAIDRGTGLMRIIHRNSQGVLSYQVLPSDEAYNLAQKILKGYDRLEGLEGT